MSLPSITLTGHAQKEAWQKKVLPPVEQIGRGVWSIPIPFPGNPMRYTLSYLLMGDGDAVLVDPGWESDAGMEHLTAGLRRAGLGPTDITGVVATHYHSDHLGMARRLREASAAWVALGDREVRRLTAAENLHLVLHDDREQLRFWGVPVDRLAEVAMDYSTLKHLQTLADPDLRLKHGSLVPAKGLNLRVVTTPGHSPGHICLIDESHGLIFSGDHVLPRISPHIPLEIPGPPNPLADYYDSLGLIAFEDEMEVCPAHEYRFIGMHRRVAQLIEHNQQRSAEVLRVVDKYGPRTIWDIARRLTWSRGWESLQSFSLRLALSETASHVVYLGSQGHELPGADSLPAALR
ncbi:MBL fold metallo-hydrolase [Paenarthrobacter sp. NPDC089316]|uniref:MBL fold metallo-hydrolase n=1 Tax=unclassified Paenarthrobacter TaxID=2634190 RepID=UPI00341857F1